MAFFHRHIRQAYPSPMWVIDFKIYFNLCIFLQLLAVRHCFLLVVPDNLPNYVHIPAPMEEEADDDDDDDDGDDHE
jgi:hypothetical protein